VVPLWAILLLTPPEPAPDGDPTTATQTATQTATAPADPDPNDESALERAAQEAFAQERYADTVRLAARAFELTGDYRHLYAAAHAERFRGNCGAALGLYARVMAAEPTNELGELARRGIQLCEETHSDPGSIAAPTSPPDPSSEPAPEVATSPDPTPEPPRPRPRWIRDPLGGTLLGTGIVAVAVGAGLWVQSSADLRAADRAEDEAAFAGARQRAQGFRIGGIIGFAAGGALLTGAAIRYGLVARPRRLGAIALGRALGRGVVLGWSGSF
jgi:hypothetical protein